MGRCVWKVFTGNELAALLGWWMLLNWKETHPESAEIEGVYMLATAVSSRILKAMAEMEGFHFEVSEKTRGIDSETGKPFCLSSISVHQ